MRIRWVFFSGAALLLGAAVATILAPAPGNAVAKEIIQLQRDVSLLLNAQRDLQRSVDEKHAVLKTLLEQQSDSVGRLTGSMGALDKSVRDVQANSGARMDTVATQVQALADNLEEVKVRLGRFSQQLADVQNVMQTLDAKLAGGAPVPGTPDATQPTAPPPSAETLYNNALRDWQGGKYDLARQEFLDYLKYFPDTDLAGNCQFYLGEILYAQKQYREAVIEYDKVLDNYPKSFKLADARLKKGLALLELGQRSSGQRELREVIRRHPGTEAERRARAKLRELGSNPSE
jgi:tol-pal system protein YbgF